MTEDTAVHTPKVRVESPITVEQARQLASESSSKPCRATENIPSAAAPLYRRFESVGGKRKVCAVLKAETVEIKSSHLGKAPGGRSQASLMGWLQLQSVG